jgi:hypothetical protein
MPIRTLTQAQINLATLVQMQEDEIEEDSTLEFKREIALDGRDKLSKPASSIFSNTSPQWQTPTAAS